MGTERTSTCLCKLPSLYENHWYCTPLYLDVQVQEHTTVHTSCYKYVKSLFKYDRSVTDNTMDIRSTDKTVCIATTHNIHKSFIKFKMQSPHLLLTDAFICNRTFYF